jgi:parallel beta-helix repeat protein
VKKVLLSLLFVLAAGSVSAASINVTTLADSGPGSLRDAITQANNGNCSHCVIGFSVAGEIALTSPLPSLLDGDMTIDGYTAPGASPNTKAFGQPDNAVITIGINGQGIVGTGFNLVGNGEELRGLAIYGFTAAGNGQGVLSTSAAKVVILGNFIGTDRSGNNAMPNDRGIVLGGVGANATIGTSDPADRNIISGNNAEGLLTQGGAVVGKMVGNYIGLSASMGALGNNIGVSMLSHNQRVGDSTGGNIISGNHSYGIYTTFGTITITRNIIGTNGSGTAIPNAGGICGAGTNGLTGSTIDNNTISGNTGFGIRVEQSSGTSITGNRIGVGTDGSTSVPNSGPGILIAGGSNDSVNGNTIANNGGNAVTITGSGKGNVIQANAIFSNGGGIDLGGDGASANDPTDSDSGPNNRQNWPSVDTATLYTTRLEIVTSINSAGAPGTAGLVVDVYKADASPWPEGMRYLGTSGCIAANTLNGYTFNVPPTGMASGDGVVLVATSYSDTACTAVNDGSSEFSGGKPVDACIEPAVTITPSASRICAGTSATLDAGSGFASYQWSTGETTRTIAVAPASTTNYTVTVINGLGCSATANTTITVDTPPSPVISPAGPTTFCSGSNVTLNASGGGSLQWMLNGQPINSATGPSYAASATGSYTVVATNGVCVVTSAPVTVTVNSFPNATVTAPTVVCANGGGTASVPSASGATYNWTVGNGVIAGGQGTNSITFTAAASGSIAISVAVTTNSCTSNGSANVPIDSFSPVVTPGGPTSFCAGGNVVLSATAGGVSYQWLLNGSPIGSANASSFTATASGAYSVTVVNSNGCSVTSPAVNVTSKPLPVANITAPSSVCANTSSNASVQAQSGAQYTWSVSNGAIASGQGTNSITFTAAASGNVAISVAVMTNGCTSNGSANIPIDSFSPVVTPGGPTSFCAGGNVVLSATAGGVSYQWVLDGSPITNANASSFTATASGAYSVTVGNGNGCTVTSAAVNVTSKPLPVANITAPSSVCANTSSSASVLAQSGAQYAWTIANAAITGGQGTDTITFFAGTSGSVSFGVTVTINGCSTSGNAQTAIGSFVPSVSASGPTTFCNGGSVTLTASAATSYQWLKNGQPVGSNSQNLFVNSSGSYSVTAVDGSCSGTSSAVNVVVNPTPTIAIAGASSVCPNAPAVLDATSGFASYHWSTGATTRSITVTPSATTNYSVTGTDANGCSASANATVTVAPVADPTITAPVSVDAAQTGNVASVAAGPAGTSYVWSIDHGTITSGNGTPAITWDAGNVSPIVISLVATTGSCSVSNQVHVGVNGQADLGVAVNAAGSVSPGGPVTITITSSNGGPSVAVNVTVSTTLPSGFAINSVSSDAWTCIPVSATVVCNAQNAFLGSLATITIHATAPAVAGPYDVTAEIFSSTPDTNAANNSATAHINVTPVTTGGCSTTAPVILTPFDGATGVASNVQFNWSATPNASGYALYVGSGNAAPSLVATTGSLGAGISLPAGLNTAYVLASFPNDCPPLLSARVVFHVAQNASCNSAPAELLTPTSLLAPSSPVQFTWNAVNGATNYRLWIAPNGGPAQDVAVTDQTQASIPLPGGDYLFYVESLFPGCQSSRSNSNRFTVAAKDPCADRALPIPVAPANGATVPLSKINFRWGLTPNASGYRVWISVDGSPFASLGTTQSLTFPAYIGRGVVDWYVEALFDGCASTESAHWKLTVPSAESCGSELPVLLAPANGLTTSSRDIDFQWSAVPGAVAYELWVALADNSATLMGTTETTSLRRSMPAGSFDWFVRAIVSGCTSRDSATNRFTYTLPPGCASQRPVLILPVDDARTIIAPVDFHWSKIPGATQYEVWVSSNHLPPVRLGATSDVQLNGQPVPIGAAEWYVVALFDSCPPLASTPNTFTVVGGPNCGSFDIPSLRAPSEVSPDVRYHVRWSSIGSAQLYEVEESLDREFGGAESFMTRLPEMDFKHSNPGSAAIPYFYRVRSVSVCTGARSLFSPVASVNVLPSTFNGQNEIHGATPADDRQTLHTHLLLGGPGGGGATSTAVGDKFSVTTNVPWLTISPSSGTIPAGGALLDLAMDPSALPFGVTSGDLFISTGGATSSSHGAGRIRTLGDTPTTSTQVSVNVSQPVSTAAKNTPAPDSLIFAAVAHATGGAQSFLSDMRLTNASPQVMKYQLTFTPTGEGGISASKSTSINIEPGRTGALNDVLATWFGVTPLSPSASGALEVRPLTTTTTSTSGAPRGGIPNVVTFAASRLYSVGAAGSFGQYIPPTAYVNFISKTATDATAASALTLQQTAQSSTRHTNLGLIEGSGDPVTVLLSVFNDAGQKIKDFTQALKGGQNLQLNSVLVAQGLSFNDGRIEARVTGGNGKVTTYASVVEDATGDSTLISPVSIRSLGATRYVVPGVAQLSSDFANWRTDVRVFNGGTDAVTTTMTYFPQEGDPVSKQVTIAAKEVKTYDSALQSLFGLTTGGGALHIDTTATSSLVATARTYNQTPTGAFGQFIPAATLSDSAGRDSRALQLIELEESSRFRTNLGLAEMTGNAVQVELTIVPPDGKLAGKAVVDLPANGFRQFSSIIKSAGFDSNYDVRVTAKVIGGNGRITAYASVIDMSSGDPTFIPAQ